jgi:hypothetical protein
VDSKSALKEWIERVSGCVPVVRKHLFRDHSKASDSQAWKGIISLVIRAKVELDSTRKDVSLHPYGQGCLDYELLDGTHVCHIMIEVHPSHCPLLGTLEGLFYDCPTYQTGMPNTSNPHLLGHGKDWGGRDGVLLKTQKAIQALDIDAFRIHHPLLDSACQSVAHVGPPIAEGWDSETPCEKEPHQFFHGHGWVQGGVWVCTDGPEDLDGPDAVTKLHGLVECPADELEGLDSGGSTEKSPYLGPSVIHGIISRFLDEDMGVFEVVLEDAKDDRRVVENAHLCSDFNGKTRGGKLSPKMFFSWKMSD